MRTLALVTCAAILCLFAGLDAAPAQEATKGCSSEHLPNAAQILRCGGATIVAEDGAKFSLQDRDKNGNVDGVDLQSRAILVDAGKQRGQVFWPEPGDEVVVGFLNGDPRQAILLGALHGKTNAPFPTPAEALKETA